MPCIRLDLPATAGKLGRDPRLETARRLRVGKPIKAFKSIINIARFIRADKCEKPAVAFNIQFSFHPCCWPEHSDMARRKR